MEPVVVAGIALVVFLLIALIVVIATRLVERRPSPVDVARAYLDAIAEGDASTANAIFRPASISREFLPAGPVDLVSLTSDAALRGASERISSVVLGRLTRATRSDVAGIDFAYRLAGHTRTGHLSLVWNPGAGSMGEWTLATGLWQLIQLRPVWRAGETRRRVVEIEVGEAVAVAGDEQATIQTGSLLAYPGVYSIRLRAPGWIHDPGFDVPTVVELTSDQSPPVVRPHFVWAGSETLPDGHHTTRIDEADPDAIHE